MPTATATSTAAEGGQAVQVQTHQDTELPQNPETGIAMGPGTASSCPRKCSCRSTAENIHSLKIRCDEQQITNWRELDFGEDVTSIVSM